jgi:hypothetical protein
MHWWNNTAENGEVVIESRHEAHGINGKQLMYYTISRAFINIPGIIVLYSSPSILFQNKLHPPNQTKTTMLIPSTPAYAFAYPFFLEEVIALSNASIIPSYIILWS